MGKSSNPLQNSSIFNLFLSLIPSARDTIPTLKELQDLELLYLYSVFLNLVRVWKFSNFILLQLQRTFSYRNHSTIKMVSFLSSSRPFTLQLFVTFLSYFSLKPFSFSAFSSFGKFNFCKFFTVFMHFRQYIQQISEFASAFSIHTVFSQEIQFF